MEPANLIPNDSQVKIRVLKYSKRTIKDDCFNVVWREYSDIKRSSKPKKNQAKIISIFLYHQIQVGWLKWRMTSDVLYGAKELFKLEGKFY